MKLQFLIPQYKEPDKVIKPLLDSIAMQQGIPFEEISAIICNDGSDVFLSDELLKSYPFKIRYFKEQHRGVSATRNACLKRSTAEYVMFCDADDMFFNSLGLWIVFKEMENPFDCLVSTFLEEAKDDDDRVVDYITHEKDTIFVHGKVFRRQFFLDNDIKFNDSLTIHEDSYLNVLAQTLSRRTVYCENPFYMWKWRKDSVCRCDPKYNVNTYANLLDSNEAVLTQFLNRGLQQEAANLFVSFVFDTFYTMNMPHWTNPENKEYRDFAEWKFAEHFRKYYEIWESVPDDVKFSISQSSRARKLSQGMALEQIAFPEWLDHIIQIINEWNEAHAEEDEGAVERTMKLVPVFSE